MPSKDKKKAYENGKKWREANPEKCAGYRKKQKAKGSTYTRMHRNSRLKRIYGITLEEYEEWCDRLENCCECCGRKMDRYTLDVDHCHESGENRGLLCNHCNLGIGRLGDTSEGVMQGVRYLEERGY